MIDTSVELSGSDEGDASTRRRGYSDHTSLEILMFILLACALVLPYAIAYRAPATGTYHDDAIYLVTGKSLAQGSGYRIISLPQDVAQTKYPPAFSFVLSLIWRWSPGFPQNVEFFKAVPLVCCLLWFMGSYLFIRGETGSASAARWIVLLTAACPGVVFVSTMVLSEMMFALLCIATLLTIRRLEQRNSKPWLVFTCVFLAAASFLTRTIGIALVVAAIVGVLIHHRFKLAMAMVAIYGALVTPWLRWQAHHPPPAFFSYYTKASYDAGNLLLKFTPHQKAVILAKNALFAVVTPAVLYGVGWSMFGFLLAVTFAGVAVIGFLREAISGLRAVHIFILCYVAVVFLWAGVTERFFIPILPLIFLFAYKAVSELIKRIRVRELTAVALTLVLLAAAHALVWQARVTRKYQAAAVPYSTPSDWRAMLPLLEWVRSNTAPDAVLLGLTDPMVYLYTGRRGMKGFVADPYELFYAREAQSPIGPPSALVKEIVRWHVSYLICHPSSNFKEGPYFQRLVDVLRSQYPSAFQEVWTGSDPQYRIYKIDHTQLSIAATKY